VNKHLESYNQHCAQGAEAAGVITSHDTDLGPVGEEGQPLGARARPRPFDPGKTAQPYFGKPAQEHHNLSDDSLPTSVSAGDVFRQRQAREHANLGQPRDDESQRTPEPTGEGE
jgi:hypothetical protein